MTALKLHIREDFLNLRASLPFSQAHPSPSFHTLQGVPGVRDIYAGWVAVGSLGDEALSFQHSPC